MKHYLMVYSTVDTQLGMNTEDLEKMIQKVPSRELLFGKRSDDCTAVPITSETDVSHLPSVHVESRLEFLIQSLDSYFRRVGTDWRKV